MSTGLTDVQHVSRKYRREIFDLVLKQDMAFFDDPANASGALASNLSAYPTNILETMGFNVMLILINVVNVLSSSILAIATGWKLGMVVVFGGPYVSISDRLKANHFLQHCRLWCLLATFASDLSSSSKKRLVKGLRVVQP